ncbi:trans-Golgi network integral membrane protein 1-like [Anopheles ziemanni]|nr:trans-Golgi network integral membrane protein 1-like [Anopheles ziemanni]
MAQHSVRSNDTEFIFIQELSRTVTADEDTCTNLTDVVKNLPPQLKRDELKPFAQAKHCVNSCYDKQGKEDIKDSCRLLYAGFKALVQYLDKPSSQASESHQQQSGALASNQEPSLAKDKPYNGTLGGGTELAGPKIAPNVGNKTVGGAKIPAPIPDAPIEKDGGKIVKETNKQLDNIESPPEPAVPAPQPKQEILEKEGNDDDTQLEDDGDEPNGFDEEKKDPDNPTQEGKDQPLQDELEDADTNKDNANQLDQYSKPDGNKVVDDVAQQKGHLKEDELQDHVEMSRTSEIMQGSDPFYNQNDSNFFSYFLFAMFSCVVLYVAYHNKSKLMALVVEGRRTSNGRGGFSKGRKHTAAYRKLDSNLEEAITSGSGSGGHSSSQIIY